MALHAGLSSADEHGVPQGKSSQSYCHRAAEEGEFPKIVGNYNLTCLHGVTNSIIGFLNTGTLVAKSCSPGQYPEENDTLVSCGLSEGVRWRGGLIVTLKKAGNKLVSNVD